MANPQHQFTDHLIVVGVGLIGGSIAAAVRKRYPNTRITGIGRDKDRMTLAVEAGLVNDFATSVDKHMLQTKPVVVICLPVHLIAGYVKQVAKLATPETLITDAGSVKAAICNEISGTPASQNFVGAHPIAGGEQAGFEHADEELFQNSVCILTAESDANEPKLMNRARAFWEAIGCKIQVMSAANHDHALALTSHLPHIMAAITTSAVGEQNLPLTGSGFRDTTRIAAGNASLWKEILIGNNVEVVNALDKAEEILRAYRRAIEQKDIAQVERLLENASSCRSKL